jgi:hypothetical protein
VSSASLFVLLPIHGESALEKPSTEHFYPAAKQQAESYDKAADNCPGRALVATVQTVCERAALGKMPHDAGR